MRLCLAIAALLALALPAPGQQSSVDWTSRFLGKPLYLRGFWAADQLSFYGSGAPIGDPAPGPVTLSGIDVTSGRLENKQLVLHGTRVALVQKSGNDPSLERQPIVSTTHLMFSMRRGDKRNYHAPEEIKITIQPDAAGSFETALSAIFANGLAELAPSVPVWWECYAATYFKPAANPSTSWQVSEAAVNQCVITPDDIGSSADGDTLPPQLLSSTPPQRSAFVNAMGLSGTAIFHLRVRADGVPVGLQIVRAVGGGMDEALLQSASGDRFQPGTRAGKAAPANVNFTVRFQPQQ